MPTADDAELAEQQTGLTKDEQAFVRSIHESHASGEAARATLKTDDRVLARITDGIYRQPSSALRELISNAYDADATSVYIETDAPRFSQIRIVDNGHGMSEEALARMVHHIGGSSKRTSHGAAVGTTDPKDSSRSPKGRKLIGKIGIGLFSVNQLTSHFQIITKTAGSNYRLLADVVLRTYSEDGQEPADGKFQTGSVQVVPIPAEDSASHGTEIILLNVRPRARDILRSRDRWERTFEQETLPEDEKDPSVTPPVWHAGFLAREPATDETDYLFKAEPNIPWSRDDPPGDRFQKLYNAVADQVGSTTERPDLAKTLDTYLATLWTLSLASPVAYMGKHPFELGDEDDILLFRLSNTGRGRAAAIPLKPGQTVREAAGLKAGTDDPAGGFEVFVDQVQLRRPISYDYWAAKNQGIGKPMLFVGAYRPDLSKIREDMRGGELDFEGYLFWNSKIVPKENNGVLTRINGASGALFDDTFMKYQVSEQTRLRQITSEVFISRGMDAALNIDRESFNFAHPHYQIVSNWLHRALRQLANTHKALTEEIRNQQKAAAQAEASNKLGRFASRTWTRARREPEERPPPVEVVATAAEASALRREGHLAFEQAHLPVSTAKPAAGKGARAEAARRADVLRAIATVLDAFGVLEDMPYARQHEFLDALLAIYFDSVPTE